jgi:DUF2934 family protein
MSPPDENAVNAYVMPSEKARGSMAQPMNERKGKMSDNPLEMTPERHQRIEQRAYRLWQEAGCPDGRDGEFWEQARELVGMEESGAAGTLPVGTAAPIPGKVRIDEAELQQNLGEFPGLTDQGDREQAPRRRRRR